MSWRGKASPKEKHLPGSQGNFREGWQSFEIPHSVRDDDFRVLALKNPPSVNPQSQILLILLILSKWNCYWFNLIKP